jgi:hypothetical protein
MKRIGVKGYKSINRKKNIDLTAINLLIGPNGSGKSSFINSLVLTKGMFGQGKTNKILSNNDDTSPIFDMFPTLIQINKFAESLPNPFDIIGRFNSKDVNFNSLDKEFSFSLPLELSYFKDNFNIELCYYLNENNNALLKSVRIVNLVNNSELFSLQASNLDKLARTKKIDNRKTKSNPSLETVLKFDIDYILIFLDEIKRDFSNNQKINDFSNSSISTNGNYEYNDEEEKNEDLEWENYVRSRKEFLKKLSEDFHTAEACNLNDEEDNHSYDMQYVDLIERYSKVIDQDFFNYYSINQGFQKSLKVDIKENKELYSYALELEKEWLLSLKEGIKAEWSGNNVAWIMEYLSGQNASSIYYEHIYDKNPKSGNKKLGLFNLERTPSEKTDFIFSDILIKNIFNAMQKLNSEINDLIYIPPNRVNNYKSINTSLDQDITTVFIKRLNKMQYQDTYELPIEHFINYWLAQLKLDKRVNIKTIDDIIRMYSTSERDNQGVNSDLGYGIGQLFPLICFMSLCNDEYTLTNTDLLVEPEFLDIPQNGFGNCFLIEEPEANLHPNFQSKLADIFIDASWKFGHQFIIETHSEYMVRKFQYWVAKGKIKPEDVNIYYFDNRNDDPIVEDLIITKINIKPDGSLTKSFGPGFFDEADNIAMKIFTESRNIN